MRILRLIRRNPVWAYYLSVFTISWGGILVLIGGPGNIPGTYEQASKLFGPVLLTMFAGPFVSGILMNYLIGGTAGLRDLKLRLFKWQAKPIWYARAMFTGPVLVTAILFGLTLFSRDYLPGVLTMENKLSWIIFGLGWGLLGGGLLEETGWTGFAIPQLRKKYSVLATGLIVGILWGIWHFLIAFWSSNYLGGGGPQNLFVAAFLAFYLVGLPGYRVLLVYVYDRTKSLPIIMLMHAMLSASMVILQPSKPGVVGFVWNAVLSMAIWMVVAGIAAVNKGLLTKRPAFK